MLPAWRVSAGSASESNPTSAERSHLLRAPSLLPFRRPALSRGCVRRAGSREGFE
jgi:hypothetical protein